MKKIIILCILLITTAVTTANAQFFIEGNVEFKGMNGKVTGFNSVNTNTFSISPDIGYWLNDKVAIGINPIFFISSNKNMNPNNVYDSDLDLKAQGWMFLVFGRYKLWGTEKLSLLIETPVGYGKSTQKETKYAMTTADISKSQFSVFVHPLVSYKLSEKFSIVTRCNFLSFGFNSFNSKDKVNDRKSTNNQFSFDAQSTLFNSVGGISIGFTYNF